MPAEASYALLGVYAVGVCLSVYQNRSKRCGVCEVDGVVTDALSSKTNQFMVITEAAVTIVLMVGLGLHGASRVVGWLIFSGYVGLLVWFYCFALRLFKMTSTARKKGLTVTWAVFAGSFVAAAAAAGASPLTPFLWPHAVHRIVLDGYFTARLWVGVTPKSTVILP